MSDLFTGPVRVYLQGNDVLLPVDISSEQITYWIGSEQTKLQLKDYRPIPIEAANRILEGENSFEFADIFNRSAWVEVNVNDDNSDIAIELHDSPDQVEFPILWMGVLEDNQVPALDIEWEFFRPLDPIRTAFAALVR